MIEKQYLFSAGLFGVSFLLQLHYVLIVRIWIRFLSIVSPSVDDGQIMR
jgi:hypothetical protein